MTWTHSDPVTAGNNARAYEYGRLRSDAQAGWMKPQYNASGDENAPVYTTETWTYNSVSGIVGVINVPTDATERYAIGDRVRWKQGGGYKYGIVVAVAATTISVITGTDYTLTNAGITDNYISKWVNPVGFPHYFSWAPTDVWDGSAPTVAVTTNFKFTIIGRTVFYRIKKEYSVAGANNTTVNFDAPTTTAQGQATEYNAAGAGNISTGIGGSPPTNAMKYVYLYGTSTPQIYIAVASTISAKTFWATGQYEL